MVRESKSLFQLSWPIYIELLFFMLMGVADTLMLSQYSDLSVAAVGNAQRITSLFTVLLNVVAIGVGVVVSQYLGAQKEADAKMAIKSGLYSNTLIALVLVVIIQIFGRSIFHLINTDAEIFDASLLYLRIFSLGLLFIAMTQASGAGFKSFGQTKLLMVIVGVSNVLNVILNAFIIFGLWIFPELGETGAAISSVISKAAGLTIALIFLYKRLGVHPFFLRFQPMAVHFVKIIKIGLPSALEAFVYQFTQVILLSFINIIGTYALTAHVYIQNMMMPVLVFALALAQGNQVIVGWRVGAKNYEGAYQRTIHTLKFAILIVLTIATLMYLNAEWILSIFTDDEQIINAAVRSMQVVIVLEVGRLSNLVVIQALRASGDVVFPVIIAIFSMLGIAIGLSYVFGVRLEFGLVGIFIGLAADECMRGLLVFIRWLRRDWEDKRVTT